jgi:hypothetical protein
MEASKVWRNLSSFEYCEQPCETRGIQPIFFSTAYNAPYSMLQLMSLFHHRAKKY